MFWNNGRDWLAPCKICMGNGVEALHSQSQGESPETLIAKEVYPIECPCFLVMFY